MCFDLRACLHGDGGVNFGGIGRTCAADEQRLKMVFDTSMFLTTVLLVLLYVNISLSIKHVMSE